MKTPGHGALPQGAYSERFGKEEQQREETGTEARGKKHTMLAVWFFIIALCVCALS